MLRSLIAWYHARRYNPPGYPVGGWYVAAWTLLFAFAAISYILNSGDVLEQTAAGKNLPGFQDEIWNCCWIVGGVVTIVGCFDHRRLAWLECVGLSFSSLAALIYMGGLILNGRAVGTLAIVAIGMSSQIFSWRMVKVRQFVLGRW